jgi:Asp-tRNA(Asn)/Glu-tRNA(Gln) amidotransferase A subunit family amidase
LSWHDIYQIDLGLANSENEQGDPPVIVRQTTDIRRRSFLAYCGGIGLGSSVFPGALWAQSDGGLEEITVQMVSDAAKLAGLSFNDEQAAGMLAGIQKNLAGFDSVRDIRIDQSVAPPLYFNPVVPGQVFDAERKPFVAADPGEETRPENLEEIAFWPVTRLAKLIESRQLSSVELTRMYVSRIKRHDPTLRAVITLTEDLAIQQATKADEEISSGRYRGPLHGIPWGAKDLIAKKGYRTTWGFAAYRDQVIDMDATVVERLTQAGAVLVGKLSTGEIARGDSWLGVQTRNPWKPDEGSGGSSAGPASATAAGLVGFSIGTDTTGSILGPSRTCGVTGLRPTFGRVSRHGVMPVCWSLDKVGPMCRSVEDCAIVFNAIVGPDGQDLAVTDYPFNWNGGAGTDALRVGYLKRAFERDATGDDAAALANDLRTLEEIGNAGIRPIVVELPAHADMDVLQMLLVDEAAAFDELMQTGQVDLFRQDIDEPEDMLMRIARLYPAVEYVQINRQRMLLMREMAKIFADVDVLLTPFSGSPMQSATSLTGHPSVAVQNGFDEAGRPTGIQFVGQLYGEANALALAALVQNATGYHQQHPPLFRY